MVLLRVAIILLLATPLLLSIIPIGQIFDGFDERVVSGKRVMICGASDGIGEEMVYHYAKMNAHIALVARRAEVLEEVQLILTRLELGLVTLVARPSGVPTYMPFGTTGGFPSTPFGCTQCLCNHCGSEHDRRSS